MKRALFYKELRALRPFIYLIAVIVLVDMIAMLWTPWGMEAFIKQLSMVVTELSIFHLLLGFALGSGLLVREIDDGTLNFLDGLPLTRRAVFVAKIQAAMLVLTLWPLGTIGLYTLQQLSLRESLDHALHPGLLLTFFGLSVLASAVSLTFGMLLGYLRFLCWLVLGLCVIGLNLLDAEAPALAAALNPGELLALRFTGTAWQLPEVTIWTQLGAALLFATLAYIMFICAGRMRMPTGNWPRARRLLLVPMGVAMVVASISGISVLIQREKAGASVETEKVAGVKFVPIAEGHAVTAHYTFSFPALSSARVSPFIAGADQTFAAVAGLLHIDGGGTIDVDLSGTVDNHEGTAYHDRIRMHVRDAKSIDVLAHETTHVFANRLAGGESGQQLQKMTVFNEGLAEWVEGKLSSDDESADQELAAAIVSKRHLVAPRDLANYSVFASAVDENLKYPLGAMFVDQFVRRYGPQAPKKLLKVLASPDFPRDLEGYELWQTAFQLAGFDLDMVFDDYARHLKALEPKYARQIAELPRLRGSLVKLASGYAVALRHDLPLPENAFALVRIRPGQAGDSMHFRTSYSRTTDGRILADVPREMITRGEVCFQAGVFYAGITVYEPWTCLPISSAVSIVAARKPGRP